MQVTITINGEQVSRDVEPRTLLVHFIRDTPGLTGTHWGCDTSNCGACVVLMDGKPVKSCTTLAAMCEGHEIRTVESLEVDGQLDPVQHGLPRAARAAVRLLHAGDADDRPRAAGREPRPDRARDPHGDLGRDLPLHRATRTSSARSAGRPSTKPRTKQEVVSMADRREPAEPEPERPIGFGRLKRKEDARFIRGKGTYLDDIRLPGMVHGAILRSPYAHAKIVSIDTSRGARAPGRRRGRHRQGPRDARAGVDADDLLRHPGRARRRQGPLPGPGGRVRDRRPTSTSASDALRADRRRVRAAAGGRQRPQGARPRRAADPRRQGRASATTSPARPGRPATRRRPTARSPRPTRSSRATSSTRAATRRRSRRAG